MANFGRILKLKLETLFFTSSKCTGDCARIIYHVMNWLGTPPPRKMPNFYISHTEDEQHPSTTTTSSSLSQYIGQDVDLRTCRTYHLKDMDYPFRLQAALRTLSLRIVIFVDSSWEEVG
jgi:hypothetical protein